MDNPELNSSPFGRSLHVLAHRLPRQCKAGGDWELERGFHLEILDQDLLKFTLASRVERKTAESSPILSNVQPAGQECFAIWHCPQNFQARGLESFAERVRQSEIFTCALIISHSNERSGALLDYPKYRSVWKDIEIPVLQIFQDCPPSSFFTVEKSLFDLGRVGRRLIKLGKLRRLLPW